MTYLNTSESADSQKFSTALSPSLSVSLFLPFSLPLPPSISLPLFLPPSLINDNYKSPWLNFPCAFLYYPIWNNISVNLVIFMIDLSSGPRHLFPKLSRGLHAEGSLLSPSLGISQDRRKVLTPRLLSPFIRVSELHHSSTSPSAQSWCSHSLICNAPERIPQWTSCTDTWVSETVFQQAQPPALALWYPLLTNWPCLVCAGIYCW